MDFHTILHRMWDVAEDWEADVLLELAVRSGLLMRCKPCGWTYDVNEKHECEHGKRAERC